MLKENIVIFKGTKDGINIILDETAHYHDIKSALKEKVNQSKRFFENSSASIYFKGRKLNSAEENELINIITMETGLSIAPASGDDLSPRSLRNNVMPLSDLRTQRYYQKFSSSRNDTIFHRGSLRSGQSVRHAGSIVVIGDINPGGEVVAEGNIIVLGTLKGLAHAGCTGNNDCFVASLHLIPMQLRINDIITCVAEQSNKKGQPIVPSYAYIHEGQIYIAPLL